MAAITEISIIHHVAIVFFLLWLLNAFGYAYPLFYFLSFVYLLQVNDRYVTRLSRKFQFEQRRQANQRRVLRESETVRWLNHAIEKIWPICMEQIASQKIFIPIIPWFIDKYKPWTVKKATIEHLYLGRKPPMFTEMRVIRESSDDDHLVLELGLNFLTADDMSAVLVAKLQEAIGFGIVTKMHITSMHVEGKVLVGVKFIRGWPYISRLRICFAEPPYFQMTVKPIFDQGVDVTEIPGISGWLDNLLAVAFEQTLVEPNMLVVDMEKFVTPESSPQQENWFSVSVKDAIAYARVEVIEGSDMKPSDPNGLADPYVKGQIGARRFKTKIQRKTLAPKWTEEFKIPICSWEADNVLNIEVRDKDPFMDDSLGTCSVDISQFRDGERHDMWVPLENIKMGRLHLAITVVEADSKEVSEPDRHKNLSKEEKADPPKSEMAAEKGNSVSYGSSKKYHKFADTFEPINVEGQKETGIWIHHPGSDTSKTWEPRKSKSRRHLDTEIQREVESIDSFDQHEEGNEKSRNHNIFGKMFNGIFHKSQKRDDMSVSYRDPSPSPHANVKAVDSQRIGVRFMSEDGAKDTEIDDNGSESSEKDRDTLPITSDLTTAIHGDKKDTKAPHIETSSAEADDTSNDDNREVLSKNAQPPKP